MTVEETPKKKRSFFSIFGSELVLGSLVALLSVLAALAAFQGSLADSQESDKNVEGQKQITEANALYLEDNQYIIYDYTMYDGWYVNQDTNLDAAEYYKVNFSDNLNAGIARSENEPFDTAYYDAMYAEANSTYDEALTFFEEAQTAGDRANNMQMVVLIFAVGLALSAYGSLIAPEKTIRIVFAMGAIAALIAGLIKFFIS
jgi:hypothetical protein